jgi:hypothetical protein
MAVSRQNALFELSTGSVERRNDSRRGDSRILAVRLIHVAFQTQKVSAQPKGHNYWALVGSVRRQ